MRQAAVLWLCCSALLCAQAGRSELTGFVRDSAGLGLPGARVVARLAATRAEFTTAAQADGSYHLLALPAGEYLVTVTQDNFRTLQRDGVRLSLAERFALDFTLELGSVEQAVIVSAAPPLLRQTSGTVSHAVDQRQVVQLPLDGRNFVPLIALLPGVMLPPGQVLPRINGSRPRVSEYLYDGISVLQPEPGQVAYYPIIDAIAEFRVHVNSYAAEYGRSNGGVIQVATRSGGNQTRGTLFDFFRHEVLNARNLFALPGPKPLFRRNQYGFVLGGPLQRDRTFYFVAWQGTRLRTGTTRISTVPTLAQRQGVFSQPIFDPTTTRFDNNAWRRDPFPNNIVPRSRWDAAAAALLDRYPLPNAPGTANNYQRNANESTGADQFDIRLDRNFGERHRLFGRYSFLRDDSRPAAPLPDGSGNLATGVIGDTLTRADSIAAEHTWTLSPRRVNQLRFGFTQRHLRRSSLDGSAAPGIPNLPRTSFPQVLPTFELAGLQQLGPAASANSRFGTSVTQVADDWSLVLNRHALKIGVDLRWERLNVLQPPNPTGRFQFDNLLTGGLSPAGIPQTATGNAVASFLLGQVQSFSLDAQAETLRPRAAISEIYAQDDWRVHSRLVLNLGVRYTLNWPSTEANNRAAVFNLATQQLDLLGTNGVPRTARRLEKTNFAPRLGLAYSFDGRTVLRAGYGLTWIEQAGITTPFTTPLFPFIQTISQRSLDNRTAAFTLSQGPGIGLTPPGPNAGLGQGVFGVQRDNGSGYAQQWNFTVQRTFGADWSFETGYLGSKLTRLGVPDTNLNQLRVEDLALGPQLTRAVPNPFVGELPAGGPLGQPTIPYHQLLRAYPRFGPVALYRNNVGHSTYHAFQNRLERRFARGLTVTVSYTFSKLIDDAGAVFDSAVLTGPVSNFSAADSFNRRLEKDESTGSLPHVFASGFVWQLPGRGRVLGGWQIAGIVRAQSGALVAITQAVNQNAAFGFGVQRPNRVADPNALTTRSTGRWFDTGAFTAAPAFTVGNSSRNPVRGPGYQTADLMVGKTVRLTERVSAELRAEAFNMTNTPPLGQPNGSLGAPAFGSITTALDPRVFELVLKVHF